MTSDSHIFQQKLKHIYWKLFTNYVLRSWPHYLNYDW